MFTRQQIALADDEHDALTFSGPVAAVVGFGLALAFIGPLLFVPKDAGFQLLAVLLGFVGAVYFGFGVADGRVAVVLTEFLVSGTFLFAAWAALWVDSPWILAVAYAIHGGWDAIHHPRVLTTTSVRTWYPPFCAVFDWLIAAFILAWLTF